MPVSTLTSVTLRIALVVCASLPLVRAAAGRAAPLPRSSAAEKNSSGGESSEAELATNIRQELPRFAVSPIASVGLNTQVFSGGFMGWLYVANTLHLTFRYQLGPVMTGRELQIGHSAALLAGVPVYETHGVTTTSLIHGEEQSPDYTEYVDTEMTVPTHTLVLVEAGALASPFAYNRCNKQCQSDYFADPAAELAYVGTLAAGVRYRYFYHADGPALISSARQSLDLSVHALAFDFGSPKGEIYGAPSKDRISPSTVGFQTSIAGVVAPWFPILTEVGGGLLPATGTWFLSAGVGYYFY